MTVSCQSPFGGSTEEHSSGTGATCLAIPFDFNTPNLAELHTVEEGHRFMVLDAFYEIDTPFTGGTNAAIGFSTSAAPHNTAGDLVGGAAGNVAAGLTAGLGKGSPGTDYGSNGRVFLKGGDKILFNRIADAFTAGKGRLLLVLVEIGPVPEQVS